MRPDLYEVSVAITRPSGQSQITLLVTPLEFLEAWFAEHRHASDGNWFRFEELIEAFHQARVAIERGESTLGNLAEAERRLDERWIIGRQEG